MRRVLALALFLVASFSANATLITIDPDDYAHGTDLSQIAPGLTLQALWQPYTYSDPNTNRYYSPIAVPVVAANCDSLCGDMDGEREFGALRPTGTIAGGYGPINGYAFCLSATQGGMGSTFCRDGFTVLEMTFDNPTDFLQLETAWRSDASSIVAYNSAGERLFWCTAPSSDDCPGVQIVSEGLGSLSSTFTLEREAGDIARVIFGGMMGSANIGGITYNVPEPGTLALLSLGLFGMRLARRRKV